MTQTTKYDDAINQLPSSWLDHIFAEPDVGKPPYGCPQIEAIFRHVKKRIESLNGKTETTSYHLGMLKAADMLDVTNQDILLIAGEIGAQALRDVRAVLAWKKRQIEKEAIAQHAEKIEKSIERYDKAQKETSDGFET